MLRTTTLMIEKATVQIMWKEIFFIFVAIYVLRIITELYIVKKFKKLHKEFLSNNWDGLDEKMLKHRNLCNVFSDGPFNKPIRALHNNLCLGIASMALVNGNGIEFLQQMEYVKKEQEYELKAFVLSLYYRWRNNEEEAINYYNAFRECDSQNEELAIIMDKIFGESNNIQKDERYLNALKNFKNPAIIMLLEANGILVFEEA